MIIQRPAIKEIKRSLNSSRTLIDIIIGPRQTGKTTAAGHISQNWHGPFIYANADLSAGTGSEWIVSQWNRLRDKPSAPRQKKLLILDEIQKIAGWSGTVKGLWDEDRVKKNPVKVLLLGSSSLLLSKGLAESLAGRFFLHRFPHWNFSESKKIFNYTLDQWLYFGGYPGAARLIKDNNLWKQYITDSLIDTAISRDVLSLQTVTKPALLRNLFVLSSRFPARILSYNKMLGQMQDAGNTTTLAHYLRLLETAFLVSGLENYSGSVIKSKSSSPKLILWNNALINALDHRTFEEAKEDTAWWGQLIENSVGAHLLNSLQSIRYKIMYWRSGDNEVDFIVSAGKKLLAIEVKSGKPGKTSGLSEFRKKYPSASPVVIGSGGIDFTEFFLISPQKTFNI